MGDDEVVDQRQDVVRVRMESAVEVVENVEAWIDLVKDALPLGTIHGWCTAREQRVCLLDDRGHPTCADRAQRCGCLGGTIASRVEIELMKAAVVDLALDTVDQHNDTLGRGQLCPGMP